MKIKNRLVARLAICLPMIIAIQLLSWTKKAGIVTPPHTADTAIIVYDINSVRSYLALGDSYTIGQSVPLKDRYPVQAADALREAGYSRLKDPEIVASSGWTTEDLLEALKDKSYMFPYDLVTLLIGVNNQYQQGSAQQYKVQFTSLLQKSIAFAGNRPHRVIVLSIPDYSVTPFAAKSDRKKIAHDIDSFNIINKKIAASYKVNYIDVTEESRKALNDPSLIAYDGLHFSGKEHTIWTSLLLARMFEVLKQ